MKAKVTLKLFIVSLFLLVTSVTASARSNDGQLIYNPIEEVTTQYYKWNAKKQTYVLVPEMTVTMDNATM